MGVISVNDTITSTRFIRDPETIISSNGDFKLGFFSPEKSTHRYVAIWYLAETYIIWIANRDQPLSDLSGPGVFKIHKDGNLVVLNAQNRVIWSTNVSITATNTTAQLDDSGNLILRDVTNGKTLWDSFTHPADAAVPSMKIAANRLTGKLRDTNTFVYFTYLYPIMILLDTSPIYVYARCSSIQDFKRKL